MKTVNLKLKPGAHHSHASIPPLSDFPEEIVMGKDGAYYWPLEPNNVIAKGETECGEEGRFGDTVGVLHADIQRHYDEVN